MAIQIPNPGTGNGASGDNEFVLWSKVKDNFSATDHAASRLVGTTTGKIPKVDNTDVGLGGWGIGTSTFALQTKKTPQNVRSMETGVYSYSDEFSVAPSGPIGVMGLHFGWFNTSDAGRDAVGITFDRGTRKWASYEIRGAETTPTLHTFYTTRNTTKDTATGFIKASSPVLHVYNDSITKIHEAEQLDITVDKKGVGHYEIHGTTGLRKNDGWFMSPPRDVHGNVLCMVDLEEKDGVVILKTYKKLFDFEIVSIVHDYDNPMDIPEGVCVEFRFNDLPQEQLDEPIE